MAEPLLQALRLSVELGGRTVVDGVALTVGAGETVAIVGANGAGKTTLLRACAGLLPEASGDLTLAGIDPRNTPASMLAHRRAYAPQHPESAWDYRVDELAGIAPDPDGFIRWRDRFGLADKAMARLSALSGGERKTVHLCLTFSALGDPYGKVLLLDEPTAALDLCRAELVARAVRASAQAGAAVLAATHDLAWARTCDRVLVLQDGRLVATGTPADALTADVVRETWGVPTA
jgi:iron complex transport system ATP-binding protein